MPTFIQHSCTRTQHSSTALLHPHTPSILRVTWQDCHVKASVLCWGIARQTQRGRARGRTRARESGEASPFRRENPVPGHPKNLDPRVLRPGPPARSQSSVWASQFIPVCFKRFNRLLRIEGITANAKGRTIRRRSVHSTAEHQVRCPYAMEHTHNHAPACGTISMCVRRQIKIQGYRGSTPVASEPSRSYCQP